MHVHKLKGERREHKRKKIMTGFTLIEILVVIGIIAVLATSGMKT